MDYHSFQTLLLISYTPSACLISFFIIFLRQISHYRFYIFDIRNIVGWSHLLGHGLSFSVKVNYLPILCSNVRPTNSNLPTKFHLSWYSGYFFLETHAFLPTIFLLSWFNGYYFLGRIHLKIQTPICLSLLSYRIFRDNVPPSILIIEKFSVSFCFLGFLFRKFSIHPIQ